ncbi:MAG: acyltransferase [Sphingomonadales bacterium]|nr:acyltransferase [Sphingomonadales bacterium]
MTGRDTAGRTRSLIALDLTRFICAGLVVAFHVTGWLPSLMADTGPATAPLRAGWIGVELFFVLSGVVIAWSAEGASPLTFLGRRALRLLPAAWICASITALVLIADGTPAGEVAARWRNSVTFAPVGRAIDGSYWTLGIEVNFYLAVAVALRGSATIDRIERIAVALGVASLTWWAASMTIDLLPMQNRLIQLTLLPYGCFFALGIMIRVVQRQGATCGRVLTMIALAAACVAEIFAHAGEFAPGGGMVGWALALFAAGVLVILFAERWQDRLATRVPARIAVSLGLTTYPLYLLHQEVGRTAARWADGAGIDRGVAVAAALTITLALALWIATRVEPAMRRVMSAAVSRFRGPGPDSLRSAFPSAG